MKACVRTPAGRLHVVRSDGQRWIAACGAPLKMRADLVVHLGRRAAWRAWTLELTCPRCETLLALGPTGFRRATGW